MLGGRNDCPELGLFIGGGNSVAEDGGGESALRGQCQALERYVTCCLADARLEPVDGLLPSSLGGDEPEDGGLVRRYCGQRLESTGALVVIFEQESLST